MKRKVYRAFTTAEDVEYGTKCV